MEILGFRILSVPGIFLKLDLLIDYFLIEIFQGVHQFNDLHE